MSALPTVRPDDDEDEHVAHPSGAIVYMLRTAQQHHVNLSSMADAKASFLNGICLVTLTIVMSQWSKGPLPLPLITLSVGALVAAFFASLAIMPRVKKTKTIPQSFNLLFFGHFTELSEEEFQERLRAVFRSEKDIYGAMIRDLYQLGTVLQRRKYFYLALGFRSLIGGIVATFIATIVELFTRHG